MLSEDRDYAEVTGFEPAVPFTALFISSEAQSTALAHFHIPRLSAWKFFLTRLGILTSLAWKRKDSNLRSG